jgi:hypothetical protein
VILNRALAKKPGDRYQRVSEMAKDLRKVLETLAAGVGRLRRDDSCGTRSVAAGSDGAEPHDHDHAAAAVPGAESTLA